MPSKKIYLVSESNQNGKKADPLKPNFINAEDQSKNQSFSYFTLFRYASCVDKLCILVGIVGSILLAAVQPLNNILFGHLTNQVVDFAIAQKKYNIDQDHKIYDEALNKFMNDIEYFAIGMAVFGGVTLVLSYIVTEAFNFSSVRQIFKIRNMYFRKALSQDISWYDQNQTGEFATRMTDDLQKIEEGIGEKIPLFLNFQCVFLSSIIVAFLTGWELTLICLTSLPFAIICIVIIGFVSSLFALKEADAYGAAGAVAEEVIGCMRTVLAFGGQWKEIKRYDENLVTAKTNNIKRAFFTALGFGLLWFFIYLSYAIAFWFGVEYILEDKNNPDGVYNPGTMIQVFFLVMNGTMSFSLSISYIEPFAKAKASGTKVFSVIDTKPVINLSKHKGKIADNLKGNINFKDVYFHYPTRKDVPILQGLDLEIKAGETVALVGNSGCGKSTCVQLLQRFYDPISGQITIDDENMRDLNLSWYRQNIAVVGQEPVLFGTTIEENIRYGNMDVTRDEIIQATKEANAYEFIQALPNGFNTLVGEKGAQLSGGQKQRIAIARALVRNPVILLLDEATSALDNESESKVQHALDLASKERTTIIVAHRLSTIRGANKIAVLSNGKVVEQGTHEELMDLKSAYFNLVTKQLVEKEDTEEDNKKMISVRQLSKMGSANYDDEDKFLDEGIENERNVSLWQILKLNSPEWPSILIASVGAILMGFSMPIFALLFGDIVKVLSYPDDEQVKQDAKTYCVYFAIAGVVIGISNFVNMYCFSYAGELMTLRLRSNMFKAMLRQEIGWYDRKENGVGALCARLSGEAALVQGATGQRIGTILQSLATLFLSVGMAMYYSWKLGLVTMAFSPFILIAVFLQQRLMNVENKSQHKSAEKSARIAVEATTNVKTVVSLNAEEIFHKLYIDELYPHYKKTLRNTHFRSFVFAMARSLMFFAYGTAMYYGGFLVRDGMPYENVFKVSQALIMGTVTIANALAFSPNLQKGVTAAGKAIRLLKRVPKIRDIPGSVDKDWDNANITYSQVYFSYPTRASTPVLRGLDLSILQGKTVALVGSSGCGKSTVIQLIERFYDPNDGCVSVENQDVKEIKMESLRSNLGIVSQEPNLFDRTIKDNIGYGDNTREISEEEIIEAAKQANIHNFIASLPLGYETRLGEKGTQLSGGQKQRVAIARALVRNPKVLLLDEATSALDTESEKIVQEALDKAKKGRTCIMIAHRLTTIQDADVICVIHKGRVVELGTHTELLEKKGRYSQLYSLQAK